MKVGPLKLKLQLACGESYAMGLGKADLLEAIARNGSMPAAGRALGMSYRRAWLLVDEINRCFHERLIETLSGGGRERGARLTEAGRSVLAACRELDREAAHLAEHPLYRSLTKLLRGEPVPPTT